MEHYAIYSPSAVDEPDYRKLTSLRSPQLRQSDPDNYVKSRNPINFIKILFSSPRCCRQIPKISYSRTSQTCWQSWSPSRMLASSRSRLVSRRCDLPRLDFHCSSCSRRTRWSSQWNVSWILDNFFCTTKTIKVIRSHTRLLSSSSFARS